MTQYKNSAITKKKNFLQKIGLNIRKKLVGCYTWIIAIYCADTCTIQEINENTWKVLKCCAAEEWRKSDESCEKCECVKKKSRWRGISYKQ
jgi:hypothetical protein